MSFMPHWALKISKQLHLLTAWTRQNALHGEDGHEIFIKWMNTLEKPLHRQTKIRTSSKSLKLPIKWYILARLYFEF